MDHDPRSQALLEISQRRSSHMANIALQILQMPHDVQMYGAPLRQIATKYLASYLEPCDCKDKAPT